MNRPNVIFIMADDMGYGDVGCYNPDSKIPTPNMDRLGNEGMRFADAHSPSAVCTPTRYSVLTGRYCWRTKLKEGVVNGYGPPLIEANRSTLASKLKSEGYHCACIGKWHIGVQYKDKFGNVLETEKMVPDHKEMEKAIDFSQPVSGGPADYGFDYSFFTAGCSTCMPPYAFIKNKSFTQIPEEYYTDPVYQSRPGAMVSDWQHKDVDPVFTEKAVEYIKSRKKRKEPFFLYLAPSAPHEPCVKSVVPEFARGKSEAGPRGDLVWLFDWTVGQVRKALEENNILDNTLFVVTSDNGALPGDRVLDEKGKKILDGDGEEFYYTYGHKPCGDWRGYKAHIWEGGHREPLIVRYPPEIKAGSICDDLIGLQDFYATCAEFLGVELSDETAEDSLSFWQSLTHKSGNADIRKDLIHHSAFGVFSIRNSQWKLIIGTEGSGGWPPPRDKNPSGGGGQLYNITEDPFERNNLFAEYPEIVEDLTRKVEMYKKRGRTVQFDAASGTRKLIIS